MPKPLAFALLLIIASLAIAFAIKRPSKALAEEAEAKPAPAFTDEYEATMRMLSAHAPLRHPEVLNANSLSNRLVLESMIKKGLKATRTPPPFIPDVPAPDSDIVGSLEGRFKVDNKGNGEVSFKLPIPQSRSNFSPYLSLSYSSRSGTHEAGQRFYISQGFYNSIKRGRSIIARDGNALGTEYGPDDKFYLDGKRLLCTTGLETYGLPGSEYRTEVDNFVQIKAVGSQNRIESFILTNKQGRTYHFGNYKEETDGMQAGHDVLANQPGSVPRTYALKRVEDQYGDYAHYHYDYKGNGEWLLEKLLYSAAPSLPPQFAIEFTYFKRKNASTTFRSHHQIDNTHIIDKVEIRHIPSNIIVNRYQLQYDFSADDRVYRLIQVDPYLRRNIHAPLQSLSPTRFFWSRGFQNEGSYLPLASPTAQSNKPKSKKQPSFLLADINGDAKLDALHLNKNQVQIRLSAKNGFSPSFSSEFKLDGIANATTILTADINGDALDDLCYLDSKNVFRIHQSTGNTFDQSYKIDISQRLPKEALPLSGLHIDDITGDGRDDLIAISKKHQIFAFESIGADFKKPIPSSLGTLPSADNFKIISSVLIDLNNDGNQDLLFLEDSKNSPRQLKIRYCLSLPHARFSRAFTIHEWKDLGSQPISGYSALLSNHCALAMGDFNGDGQPDLIIGSTNAQNRDALTWKVILNRGHPCRLEHLSQKQLENLYAPKPLNSSSGFALGATIESPRVSKRAPSLQVQDRPLTIQNASQLQSVDVNRDGWDDLIWRAASTSETVPPSAVSWHCRLSNGDGTFQKSSILDTPLWKQLLAFEDTPHNEKRILIDPDNDLNGDGIDDFIVRSIQAEGTSKILSAISGANEKQISTRIPNLMTAIVDGRGEVTCIAYKSGRDDSIYTPGSPVAFPTREIRKSAPVVTHLWRDAREDSFNQFSYLYSGERSDFSGRGGLGFASFITIDRQTGFISYQHLTQSFPTTGLKKHEGVLYSWKKGSNIHLKQVSKTDYFPTYDAVVDPENNRFYGTLKPFTSRNINYKWPETIEADFSFQIKDIDQIDPTNPLFPYKFDKQALYAITETHWIDQQDQDRTPPVSLYDIRVPYALEEFIEAKPHRLPGQITFGNTTKNRTDYGFGFFKEDKTQFRPPSSPEDPFISLRSQFESSEKVDQRGLRQGPTIEYAYQLNSNRLVKKSVDNRDNPDAENKTLAITHYTRDEQGRQIEEISETLEKDQTESTSKTTYRATDFDETFNRPLTVSYTDEEKRWLDYHPFFHKSQETKYERGITVLYEYDELNREREVANPKYNYIRTNDYTWTTLNATDWTQTQTVAPPQEIDGIVNTSAYAIRKVESGKDTIITYYDKADRAIRIATIDVSLQTTYTDTIYDDADRELALSESYTPETDTITWNKRIFDSYGRIAEETKIKAKPIPSHSPISQSKFTEQVLQYRSPFPLIR